MKKRFWMTFVSALPFIFAVQFSFASDSYSKSDHSSHSTSGSTGPRAHDMADKDMDHGNGMKIHASKVDGYTFEYRLIDMKEKIKGMANMPEMKDTHHLMVFVKDTRGTVVNAAKVGYLIRENGSGDIQKKMAMGMNNGFGADVTLAPGNHYRIKTKVMADGKKFMDAFDYSGTGK